MKSVEKPLKTALFPLGRLFFLARSPLRPAMSPLRLARSLCVLLCRLIPKRQPRRATQSRRHARAHAHPYGPHTRVCLGPMLAMDGLCFLVPAKCASRPDVNAACCHLPHPHPPPPTHRPHGGSHAVSGVDKHCRQAEICRSWQAPWAASCQAQPGPRALAMLKRQGHPGSIRRCASAPLRS